MDNIYRYNNSFDKDEVLKGMAEIERRIDEETEKDEEEYDEEKVRKLVYQQFFQGLKLSTGYRYF